MPRSDSARTESQQGFFYLLGHCNRLFSGLLLSFLSLCFYVSLSLRISVSPLYLYISPLYLSISPKPILTYNLSVCLPSSIFSFSCKECFSSSIQTQSSNPRPLCLESSALTNDLNMVHRLVENFFDFSIQRLNI